MDPTVDMIKDATTDTTMTLFEFFDLGGWAMWPLLIFSFLTLVIIIERIIYIASHKLGTKYVYSDIIPHISKKGIKDTINLLASSFLQYVATPIMASGLEMLPHGEHRMEKAMEARAAEKINDLERGLNFLVALGSLAPITGFLGTVSGMISAFQSIATADDVSAKLVAKGIFEALITTAYGLSIAIVAIAGYYVLSHIVDSFAARIEQAGSDLINTVLSESRENDNDES